MQKCFNDGKVNLSELIRDYGEIGNKTVVTHEKRIESLERQLAIKDEQLAQLHGTIKLLEYKSENSPSKSLLVRIKIFIS